MSEGFLGRAECLEVQAGLPEVEDVRSMRTLWSRLAKDLGWVVVLPVAHRTNLKATALLERVVAAATALMAG